MGSKFMNQTYVCLLEGWVVRGSKGCQVPFLCITIHIEKHVKKLNKRTLMKWP